jgi:invasion protein IalB
MKQLTAVVCLAALIGAVTPVQAQKAERPAEKKSAQYQPYDVSGKKPGAEANVCDKSTHTVRGIRHEVLRVSGVRRKRRDARRLPEVRRRDALHGEENGLRLPKE